VGDEVVPRLAELIGVTVAGEDEGPLDLAPVLPGRGAAVEVRDGVELLDQGEEVAEENALLLRQAAGELVERGRRVGAVLGGADLRVAATVLRNRVRRPVAAPVRRRRRLDGRVGLRPRLGVVGPYGRLRLSRYRLASSWRAA
jgi:hypothetical protein